MSIFAKATDELKKLPQLVAMKNPDWSLPWGLLPHPDGMFLNTLNGLCIAVGMEKSGDLFQKNPHIPCCFVVSCPGSEIGGGSGRSSHWVMRITDHDDAEKLLLTWKAQAKGLGLI